MQLYSKEKVSMKKTNHPNYLKQKHFNAKNWLHGYQNS